jgi:16S rRNA (adenine1518-N6/adenine1519-N6)-dimethyltransferase
MKPFNVSEEFNKGPILDKRAEQLDVQEFIRLTQKIQESWSQ